MVLEIKLICCCRQYASQLACSQIQLTLKYTQTVSLRCCFCVLSFENAKKKGHQSRNLRYDYQLRQLGLVSLAGCQIVSLIQCLLPILSSFTLLVNLNIYKFSVVVDLLKLLSDWPAAHPPVLTTKQPDGSYLIYLPKIEHYSRRTPGTNDLVCCCRQYARQPEC